MMTKEAFDPIAPSDLASNPVAKNQKAKKTPIVPIPANAPLPRWKHPRFGYPTAHWIYRDELGNALWYTVRLEWFDTEHNKWQKEVMPLCFCQLEDGTQRWRSVGPPKDKKRPLYNLPVLS